jgi:hypothetical protein
VTAVHRGDYSELGRTHDAVGDFIAAHGLVRVGPSQFVNAAGRRRA